MAAYFALILFATLVIICSGQGHQYVRYRRQHNGDNDFVYDEPYGAMRSFHRARRQLNPQSVQRFRDYGLNELEANVAADLFANLMAAMAEKMDPQMQKIVESYVEAKNNGIPYQPMPIMVPPPLIQQSQSPSSPPQQGQPIRLPQNLQQPNQPQMQRPQATGQNIQQGQGQMRPPQHQGQGQMGPPQLQGQQQAPHFNQQNGQQQPPQHNQQNGQQFQPPQHNQQNGQQFQQQQQYRPQGQVYAPPQGQLNRQEQPIRG